MLPNPFMPKTKIGQNIAWCWPNLGRQSSDFQSSFASSNDFVNWNNSLSATVSGEQVMTRTNVSQDLVRRDLFWDGGNDGMYVEFTFIEQQTLGALWLFSDAYVIVNGKKADFGNFLFDNGTRFESGHFQWHILEQGQRADGRRPESQGEVVSELGCHHAG